MTFQTFHTSFSSTGRNVSCLHVFPDQRNGPSVGSEIEFNHRSVLPSIRDVAVLFLHGLVEGGRNVN